MERKDKIKALVDKVTDMEYGSVISFNDIEAVIGDRHGTGSFNDIVQAAKKELLVAGYMIDSVRRVGYKVVEPNSYTHYGVRMVKAGARRIDKGVKVMQHAPVNKMTPEAREAHNRVYDSIMNLQAAMSGSTVTIHMLEKKRKHPYLEAK